MKIGISLRGVACHLKRNPSTLSREMKRGVRNEKGYQAWASQKGYYERRKPSKPGGKFTSDLKVEWETKLKQTGSPEQIAEKYRTEGFLQACFKTIYRGLAVS